MRPGLESGRSAQFLDRLVYSPTLASLDRLRRIEFSFPLDSALHEQIGLPEMLDAHQPDNAWREFRIADRLAPGDWSLPALQAWLSRETSPGMSFHFWSLAIERSGRRAGELFLAAYRDSANLRGGQEFWLSYAEGHPEFLLTYAELAPRAALSQAAYADWWKARGDSSLGMEAWETAAFYYCVRKWGNPAQFQIWMNRHREIEQADYKTCARILHEWNMDADAWAILSRHIKEPTSHPPFHPRRPNALEADWRIIPTIP